MQGETIAERPVMDMNGSMACSPTAKSDSSPIDRSLPSRQHEATFPDGRGSLPNGTGRHNVE